MATKETSSIRTQCDAIRNELKYIENIAEDNAVEEEVKNIKSALLEIERTGDEQIAELDDANEAADSTHETTFGDITYKPANQHDEDVMEALDDALRHGRKLHLIEYLKAYVPDVKGYDNGQPVQPQAQSAAEKALRRLVKQIRRATNLDGFESPDELRETIETVYNQSSAILAEIEP